MPSNAPPNPMQAGRMKTTTTNRMIQALAFELTRTTLAEASLSSGGRTSLPQN